MVRYDDGSLLDAARVADACHKQGALLLLDASQSCGAIPMDVNQLGADFIVSAGYKWLLGPFGQDFLGQERTHRDGTAGAVLLDGIDGVAQFRGIKLRRSETGG